MDRIESLCEVALSHKHSHEEFYYLFHKKYNESEQSSEYLKYAEAFTFAFSHLTPHITDGELIVGEAVNHLSPAQQAEWNDVLYPVALRRKRLAAGHQHSHMAIDYDLLLSCGVNGVLQKVDGYLSSCEQDKKDFYLAAKAALNAVLTHAENYAKKAEELAEKETRAERKAELIQIAQLCRRVPANPAENFYEAVQSVHFLTYCLSLNPILLAQQQFQLGRPDRYLYPYYQKDIQNGALTKERAQLLLDCLGIQINMRVPNILTSGYMVGGRDKDGNLIENELTHMLMQVIDDIRLVYPSVGFCYTAETSDEYLATACRILSHGRSHPAIFNDDVITEGLRRRGVPENEAHSYIHSTCVEITPEGSSSVWVASPYVNVPSFLLESMDSEYESFDAHLREIFARLDRHIEEEAQHQSRMRTARTKYSFTPLLSCFVNDCLARGLDIENGGARYNWIMPSFVGVPNLVDSLYALKKVVYEDKKLTVKQLKDILDNNFDGEETLQKYLLEKLPKYGNDIDEVDGLFAVVANHILQTCSEQKNILHDGKLVPGTFCFTKHEKLGGETGATPDGRLSGMPFSDGAGACQGRAMKGPTAALLSSTKWEHRDFIGGIAVNIKFPQKNINENSLQIMQSLIKTYMLRGGFQLQVNVVDKETLKRAQINPSKYRDLVVRIGGYSDYFTRLSPGMQEEVISRTEHTL